MHKAARWSLGVLLMGIAVSSFAQTGKGGSQGNVTITTYYPSPHAVYRTLRLYPTPVSEIWAGKSCRADAQGDHTGELVYSDQGYILYCDGVVWKKTSSSASPEAIYGWVSPSGSSGAPTENFQVVGNTKISFTKFCIGGGTCSYFDDRMRWGMMCPEGYIVKYCEMIGQNSGFSNVKPSLPQGWQKHPEVIASRYFLGTDRDAIILRKNDSLNPAGTAYNPDHPREMCVSDNEEFITGINKQCDVFGLCYSPLIGEYRLRVGCVVDPNPSSATTSSASK